MPLLYLLMAPGGIGETDMMSNDQDSRQKKQKATVQFHMPEKPRRWLEVPAQRCGASSG